MATRKGLSLIFEIQNFANSYLGKVTKFQGHGLCRFGVLSNLLGWRWKTPPPGTNRVNGANYGEKLGMQSSLTRTKNKVYRDLLSQSEIRKKF